MTGAFRSRASAAPYALVHRADLQRALLDVCTADANVELRSSTAFASYEDTGDGVLVATARGTTVEAEAIIGRAFASDSAQRYLRTGRCRVMARVYGGFYHAKGVTRELATALLSARTPSDSFESLAWLYDFDPGPIGTLADK